MNYVQGFVTPVPTANKEKYRKTGDRRLRNFSSSSASSGCLKPGATMFPKAR